MTDTYQLPIIRTCNECRIEKPIAEFDQIKTKSGAWYTSCRGCRALPAPFNTLASSTRQGAIVRGYTGTEHATSVQLVEKFAEFGNACVYCGRSDLQLSPDHDIPIKRGGSNAISNILPSCLPCNLDKKALTGAEYRDLLAGGPRPPRRSKWNRIAVLKSVKTGTMSGPLVKALIEAGWTPPRDPTVAPPPRPRGRPMTTTEVAAILVVDRASVARYIERGDLRACNFGPTGASRKTLRIFEDDLQSFIAKRSTIPEVEA